LCVAGRPEGEGCPWGYGRMDYLASMLIGVLILNFGWEVLKLSFDKVLHPVAVTFSWVTFIVLMSTILAKLWLSAAYMTFARHIDSQTLAAAGEDSRNDVLATGATVISLLASLVTDLPVDGILGLLIGALIIKTGIEVMKEAVDTILGQKPDPEVVQKIQDYVMSYPEVLGVHDMIVHNYGPGAYMASLHAEVSANEDPISIHDKVDLVERKILKDLNVHLSIHTDPLDVDNEEVLRVRKQVDGLIRSIDDTLEMHDFRMATLLTHANLIFDVAVPFQFKMKDEELLSRIEKDIKTLDERYEAVVTLDRVYLR